MADRVTEFLDLLEVQQLTLTEYLKISQVAGQRARQDIPSFGACRFSSILPVTLNLSGHPDETVSVLSR